MRLALSATPERHYDDIGTQNIVEYFGDILQPEFTLKDAIEQGALVHYLYYPIPIELTESESATYLKLSRAIARKLLYQSKDRAFSYEELDTPDLIPLLMQRARLIGAAANKLTALRELMIDRLHTSHTLFYCGDGSSDTSDPCDDDRDKPLTASGTQQLAAVTHLLGNELGYRINTYTAATSLPDREQLRQQFESGALQGLVAIRCLDEGIDIPAIKHAVILASSTNPRQFIQRRGRILRPDRGKDRATLYDMVVLPPQLVGKASLKENRDTIELERNLLKKELLRLIEFADLADNTATARAQLLTIQKRYGLIDL